MALSYFTTKAWKFENSKFLGLIDKIPDVDRKEFDYSFEDIDVTEFMKNATIGSQKYLFNMDESNRPFAKKQFNRYEAFESI